LIRFFTPTIEAMKEKSNLYILVLCNGGYDGLGKERTVEMARAAKHMGFRGHKVIDDVRNKDGPVIWSADIVQEHIETYLQERAAQGIAIKTIVTFDDGGVSHHPNHIACHFGVMKFYDTHVKSGKSSRWQDMDVYTLETVPGYRTYAGWLDIFMSRKD
jgi:N-acetylglucosaminylphosphatidylinositol deacetylase